MKFVSALLTVQDIEKSKDFYAGILGREGLSSHEICRATGLGEGFVRASM